MILPHGGDLFFRDAAGAITQLTDAAEPVIDPKLCDDGTQVALREEGRARRSSTRAPARRPRSPTAPPRA